MIRGVDSDDAGELSLVENFFEEWWPSSIRTPQLGKRGGSEQRRLSLEDCYVDVLIVDDDADVLRAHKKMLERAGFMVTCVDNGLAAFAQLQQRTFRAILCDIEMPYLGGRSLYEQLKESFPHMAGRVVFVSGWASEAQTREFLEQTGQPVLDKPADLEDLVRLVRQMVEKPLQTRNST